MNIQFRTVSTAAELLAAAGEPGIRKIAIAGDLIDLPMLRLSPGQSLAGNGATRPTLRFAAGSDGIQFSSDNSIENLTLVTDVDRCAILNDSTTEQLGFLSLRRLTVTGAVRLLANGSVRGGHVEAHDIDIMAADARGYETRPKGYGVEVIPGAFTLWNQQPDAGVTITAAITGVSAGRAGAPVRGSGIFVSGANSGGGGRMIVSRLETLAVYCDGGIAPGTPDRISGGVFTVYGAFVDTVVCRGPVTTYGPNDMVLDNWGTVDRWIVEEKVTSHGPSAIGFVNFGALNLLQVNAPIETFGQGSRGFNVYDGTVKRAEFERLITHADGAVGIQISRPVGNIVVRRGIETYGGVGDSLVKGVVVKLAATPFSVKPGGSASAVEISGGVIARGMGISPLELHGNIEMLRITETVSSAGSFD